MAIYWSDAIEVHEAVELQLGVSQDKTTIYLLTVAVEGNEAWLNWFDGNGQRIDGVQAPPTLALAQQGYLQKIAEIEDSKIR